jgi:hypothetical protein
MYKNKFNFTAVRMQFFYLSLVGLQSAHFAAMHFRGGGVNFNEASGKKKKIFTVAVQRIKHLQF